MCLDVSATIKPHTVSGRLHTSTIKNSDTADDPRAFIYIAQLKCLLMKDYSPILIHFITYYSWILRKHLRINYVSKVNQRQKIDSRHSTKSCELAILSLHCVLFIYLMLVYWCSTLGLLSIYLC